MTTTDVRIEDHGSVVVFTPMTSEARVWLAENVETEPWQWMGASLVVDHRFAFDLADGLAMFGLTVSRNT